MWGTGSPDAAANGLDELFEIGREIVVYRDDRDLLDKIACYLAHDEERKGIARAGQERTLREYTYVCSSDAAAGQRSLIFPSPGTDENGVGRG